MLCSKCGHLVHWTLVCEVSFTEESEFHLEMQVVVVVVVVVVLGGRGSDCTPWRCWGVCVWGGGVGEGDAHSRTDRLFVILIRGCNIDK